MKKLFSLVIPVYQNELNLDDTIPRCLKFLESISLEFEYEFILVNDGSKDNSFEILKRYQKSFPNTIKLINFTRNFGQRMSTRAGIQYAKGDVVGVISADLQDPVELFAKMLNDWKGGAKLVIATRESRNDSVMGDFFSKSFYKLINKYAVKDFPQGGFDFWLMDRRVAEEYLKIGERNGHLMMSVFNLGFYYTSHSYIRNKREKGHSQYNFWKKIESFYDSFLANSYVPIRAVSGLGFFSALFGFLYAIYIIIDWLFSSGKGVEGWMTIVVLISVFSGLILMSLGIIGEYIWRIYDEIRKAPLYVIDEVIDSSARKIDQC